MYVCFALTNQAEYERLSKILMQFSPEVQHGKCIYSSHHLVELLSADNTNILFADTEVEGPNLFQCIKLLKAQKPLYVILLTPSEDYFIAYQAMKSNVAEILTRPYTDEQVSEVLLEASNYLRLNSLPAPKDNINSRNAFATEMSAVLGNKTIDEINLSYYTTFQKGLFRVVSFAVDFPNARQLPNITRQLRDVVIRFIHAKQWLNTFDIVHSIVYNEIRIIFNYDPSEDEALLTTFPSMFLYVEDFCRSSPGLELFMGIGNAYPDINKLAISFKESRNAIWMRMMRTDPKQSQANVCTGRIFTYKETPLSDHQKRKLYAQDQAILQSIDGLNQPQFIEAVNTMFSFSSDVLGSSLAQDALLNEVSYFCNKYREQIECFDNVKSLYHRTKLTLLTSRSFSEYRQRYVAVMTDLFERLSGSLEVTASQNYANRVISIIQERYMTNLTLSKIAEEIHLSTNYLSRVFHEATGMSFSDYLLDQRIEAAKTLLEKTDYRLFDISNSVGYTDQRYFSRIFAKKTGVTPSEYRKYHKVPISQQIEVPPS